MKLAAWTIEEQHKKQAQQQWEPRRIERSQIDLEKHLEDWIVNDVSLIGQGLTLVGRQVTIDDGRLDLLAVDLQDRWVVIEVKPGLLDSGALNQALYYASSLARLDTEEISEKLESGFSELGDEEALSARVRQLLDEEEEREIALLLVGAGVHPGLERMNGFLGRFGIPISVVSFEVFELNGGPKLLVREVIDEAVEPPRPKRRCTVGAIRDLAVEAGVRKQFDRFVRMSEAAGLPVQAQRASVRVAPPADKRCFLMYATPRAGPNGGELGIWVGPENFAEWFPNIRAEKATAALGHYGDGDYLAGKKLTNRLAQIESFLTTYFPEPSADDG
ncbi:MAG: endonuclease NucS [Acidobacteria bacterium]|nr:endonuclease NucS [Acidobacteriota bacterium]